MDHYFRNPNDPIENKLLALGRRSIQEYGDIDLVGTKDCTRLMNLALADAAANKYELMLPAGTYKTTGPLYARGVAPRLSGMGHLTVIRPDATDYDWLTVGGGWNQGSIGPAGWVRDVVIRGLNQTEAPAGFNVGLRLDGAKFVEVRNAWVDYAPIGYDLTNNCYGSSFYNCRTTFGRCRIGMRLSGDRVGQTFASGSDINLFNCWLAGRDAAIWMERSGGGYNFFGGQLASGVGLAVPDDTLGTLTVNRNLQEVGTVGGRTSARFFGTSFEAASAMWNMRIHDIAQNPNGCQLLFAGVSFTGSPNTNDAFGVCKLTDGYNDTIEWHNCALNGVYTHPAPLDININPGAGRAQFIEFGTQSFATFAGVNLDINTYNMLAKSNVQRGFGSTSFHFLIPGMLLEGTGSVLRFSKNLVTPSWTNV